MPCAPGTRGSRSGDFWSWIPRRSLCSTRPRSTACSISTASCATSTRSSNVPSTHWRWSVSDQLASLHEASGKVREMYNFGETMLMVASDRISAFDVIMPTPIPDKGRVLTALSAFWFDRTAELVPNHLITTEQDEFPAAARTTPDLGGRSMLVRRLTMMPIECVVRGYLAGSGWKDYQSTGTVCGHRL